jgi:L-seryl-tRNA(Ser) seleniumtransferase
VLNATGVLLHTNLGRAPLSPPPGTPSTSPPGPATSSWTDHRCARRRGRGAIARAARRRPRPAGAAHLVNNGAAALALVATALAAGREIVIARGELVEIGDGFRIPDLLTATGAPVARGRHHEPGDAGRLRRCRRPGHRVRAQGPPLELSSSPASTRSVAVDELAGLGVPVVVDIGSGLLAPHPLLPDRAGRDRRR